MVVDFPGLSFNYIDLFSFFVIKKRFNEMATSSNILQYEGCNFLRQRLLLSTLSGRPIKISNIRYKDDNPGLRDFEVNLLKLIDQVTNGAKIDISATGTSFFYQPGLLTGGSFDFDCQTERGIGYYLEPLIILAPFCKKPVRATLKGITNCKSDLSPDILKVCWLPVVRKFLPDDEELDIKLIKRGLLPEGGGEVYFSSPICRTFLKPVHFLKQGKISKIRGVAYACRVSPMLANRLVDSIKKNLRQFTPNIYIYVDSRKGPASGNSPGFGATLHVQTTEGVVFGAEAVSNPVNSEPVSAEDLGISLCESLVAEIYRGGCVDSTIQPLTFLFMVLGQKDVSKVISGPLSVSSVYQLRHLKDFFGVTFKIENEAAKHQKDEESDDTEFRLKLGDPNKTRLTCVGVGYSNINKMLL